MFLAILCQYVHLLRGKAVSWAYMVPGKTGRGLRSEGWISGFDSGADEEEGEASFVCSSPFCCCSPLFFLASSSFALRSRSAKAFAPVSVVSLLGRVEYWGTYGDERRFQEAGEVRGYVDDLRWA